MTYSIEEMRDKYNTLYSYFAGDSEEGNKELSIELYYQTIDIKYKYTEPHHSIFGLLVSSYNSPERHYHTLEHIYHVLKRLEEMEADTVNRGSKFDEMTWACIKWGAWYHDYYMFSVAQKDEISSAQTAKDFVPISRGSSERNHICELVNTVIIATDHKQVPLDYPSAILCDADLAILGTNREAFDKYEENIRKEYAFVPEELYRSGRLKVLEKFYNRGKFLYNTQYARDRWGLTAMKNLEYSMRKLKGEKVGL